MNLVIKGYMELLKYLRSAAKSDTTAFTNFLLQYKSSNDHIHVFHEGKDDPSFYGNYIDPYLSRKRRAFYYQCKNKENVYKYYAKLNWKSYQKKRVLFLVDKDYSDFLAIKYPADSNIFVTKHYSIENYIVNKDVFSRCLREFMGLDNDKSNLAITRLFSKQLNQFYLASLFLSAYILYHKRNNTSINLGNITLSEIFDFNPNFIIKKKPRILARLDQLTGVKSENCFGAIRSIMTELKKTNVPKSYTRGKFEMMYFVHCINSCPAIINEGKVKGEKQYKSSISLSVTNSIPIIGPRLKQPLDIKEFILSNLSKKTAA
jgi:hypothetical protein